ncbi:MAG: 30S ribosomal protein S12 methylthiotransferase RimO [Azoarcus sp.]|jgi:ribosomal protein S12 methylthiotransferase|nr:30S ribosomal protein S12 methylthiotransferase RimO [Azoarcus sp.]
MNSSPGARPPRIGLVSLGCPKATVDAEQILTRLSAEGYEITGACGDADLVVVNTCGFIDAAIDESLDAIGEALAENGKVIVTGCLGARGEIVRAAHPRVLAVTGPHAVDEVMRAVRRHAPGPHGSPRAGLAPPQGVRLTPGHYAYLKISEGCNHACTFCVIPALRGALESRPLHAIMREAETLVDAGVREIIVVSQDTSAYGVDMGYRTGFWGGRPLKTRLPELAKALGALGVWIRLHYLYPYPSVDSIVELMAEGHILPYLDAPFQHASPRILQAMRRPASAENALERIRRWRAICPGITIRSTFITGFPGETEEDFDLLLRFLEEARLDRVGAFAYSPVEGAAANALPGALPAELRQARRDRLLAFQEDISTQCLEARIGREMTVLVDEVDEEGALARSPGEAPEIDGLVLIPDGEGLQAGDFVRVRISDCDVHDLYAERLGRRDEQNARDG